MAKLGLDPCDRDLWNLTLNICMDITSANGNIVKRCDGRRTEGRTDGQSDGRTDRQTERIDLKAGRSQLKTVKELQSTLT